MKNKFLLIMMLTALFACQEAAEVTPLPGAETSSSDGKSSTSASNGTTLFYHNAVGSPKPIEQITLTDASSVVVDSREGNFVFDNDALLREWALQSSARQPYINRLDSIALWQAYAVRHGLLDDADGTDAFSDSILNSVVRKTDIVGNHILFEGYQGGGSSIISSPGGLPLPSLLWMNNRGSSAVVAGLIVYADRTWFRGRKLWMVLAPVVLVGDFREFNFDDRAESMF
jgi:hypothetical protein